MNIPTVSVIIMFHGRLKHLVNVLKGLQLGISLPDEIILVEMAIEKSMVPNYKLNIQHYLISDYVSDKLPLARARNHGAQMATCDILTFLDVDCVPSNDFIYKIRNTSYLNNALYMARPLYLSKNVEEVCFVWLEDFAIEHPIRPNYTDTFQCEDYGQFWSLCFYMTSNLFFEIGGFDEDFIGYGAEDTDFAFKCRDYGIPLYLTDNNVYHQQHSFCRPPLNSLEAIVKNSNQFYSKWAIWPMVNHLEKFNKLGIISWNESQSNPIEIY